MHRTTIYLPTDLHGDLRVLAARMRTSISDLLRLAADETFSQEFARLRGAPDPFKIALSERGVVQQELLRGLRSLHDRCLRCNRS